MMENINKFEIHYYLKNSSHSMDAVVRNKCEAEFLAVAHEIISLIDLDIILEAEAHVEGGLRDRWKVVVNSSYTDKIATAAFLIALLQYLLPLPPHNDKELTALQKEEVKLSIEEKKLSIEKLKHELKSGNATTELAKSAAKTINQNQKIVVHKSNFYKRINYYNKVTQVGFAALNENSKPVNDEISVLRPDFPKFILLSNNLPLEIIEDAQIEIVAPVLREGNAKWKGIYILEPPISFEMKDKIFKYAVLSKQISFKNGDIISCILEIHREINEVGETVPPKYVVQTVLDKIENGIKKETASGKKYRREKELMNAQGSLDL